MVSTVALLKTVKEGRPFSVNMQYRARMGMARKEIKKYTPLEDGKSNCPFQTSTKM
jgi:hypothetical protein